MFDFFKQLATLRQTGIPPTTAPTSTPTSAPTGAGRPPDDGSDRMSNSSGESQYRFDDPMQQLDQITLDSHSWSDVQATSFRWTRRHIGLPVLALAAALVGAATLSEPSQFSAFETPVTIRPAAPDNQPVIAPDPSGLDTFGRHQPMPPVQP